MIAAFPNEGCGFILGQVSEAREAIEFVACRNIQNELNQRDPTRFPRTAETAYVIDSHEQEQVQAEAKQKGLDIIAIVHSHPNHDVYFSQEDKENACPWGEPLFPNMSYIVVSVYDAAVKAISDFYWDIEQNDFEEHKIK